MTQSDAVDVTRTREDQLLERLGKADWLIALPEELPDLIITTQWRHDLQAHAGRQFVRWVMDGIDRVLTHDYDPAWDHSGSLREIKTDPRMLLIRHELLSDWANNEFTGYSEATYDSGYGLHWTTYEADIRDHIERQVNSYFTAHCLNIWRLEDESEVFVDERWDMSDIPIITLTLSFALLEDILQLSTKDAWQWFEADIRVENEARRKKAEQHQYMLEQTQQFWEGHFPDLIGLRIEMPLFREIGLEKRISEVLADADPDMVRMLAERAYFPGNYSNTVNAWIQDIVRRANL